MALLLLWALGIGNYGAEFLEAWSGGVSLVSLLLSFVVMASISSFVVYDIVVFQGLAKEFPYNFSGFGFFRFYLDLFMAFLLYLLIANTFRIYPYPDWFTILVVISGWHLAATTWHLLAQLERKSVGSQPYTMGPHLGFIVIYWLVAFLSNLTGVEAFQLEPEPLSGFVLGMTSVTILSVSIYRWNQVAQEIIQ